MKEKTGRIMMDFTVYGNQYVKCMGRLCVVYGRRIMLDTIFPFRLITLLDPCVLIEHIVPRPSHPRRRRRLIARAAFRRNAGRQATLWDNIKIYIFV